MKNIRTCALCSKQFTSSSPYANNVRFCSVSCRLEKAKMDHPYRSRDWQRARADAKNKPASNKKQCLVCGKWYRQVSTHIVQRHELTAREYKEKYGLDVKRGILPADIIEIKAEKTRNNGTIENLKKGKKFWFKKGQPGVGVYKRSAQTMKRLHLGTAILKKKK